MTAFEWWLLRLLFFFIFYWPSAAWWFTDHLLSHGAGWRSIFVFIAIGNWVPPANESFPLEESILEDERKPPKEAGPWLFDIDSKAWTHFYTGSKLRKVIVHIKIFE